MDFYGPVTKWNIRTFGNEVQTLFNANNIITGKFIQI